MTNEQILEVQRNEAWRALEQLEHQRHVLLTDLERLRRKLAATNKEKVALLQEVEAFKTERLYA